MRYPKQHLSEKLQEYDRQQTQRRRREHPEDDEDDGFHVSFRFHVRASSIKNSLHETHTNGGVRCWTLLPSALQI